MKNAVVIQAHLFSDKAYCRQTNEEASEEQTPGIYRDIAKVFEAAGNDRFDKISRRLNCLLPLKLVVHQLADTGNDDRPVKFKPIRQSKINRNESIEDGFIGMLRLR